MKKWYWSIAGKISPPATAADLGRRLDEGLLVEALFWREGLTQWLPAAQVRTLLADDEAEAAAAVAPVLPPPAVAPTTTQIEIEYSPGDQPIGATDGGSRDVIESLVWPLRRVSMWTTMFGLLLAMYGLFLGGTSRGTGAMWLLVCFGAIWVIIGMAAAAMLRPRVARCVATGAAGREVEALLVALWRFWATVVVATSAISAVAAFALK